MSAAGPAPWSCPPRTRPGDPTRLGATALPDGVNFAVGAPAAQGMRLVLLDPSDGATLAELDFPEEYRVGDVFAMTVLDLDPSSVHYGYRPTGPAARADAPLLLDPYATGLAGGEHWGRRPRAYRCLIAGRGDSTHAPARPRVPDGELVIYELHVRGFTRHSSSGVVHPGSYAGVAEKIPYLLELGVNCVELLPVFEFDETDNTFTHPATGEPLPNFWGYNPVGFLAPKAGYAARPEPGAAAAELRDLVRRMHEAGIEVILDVVFNHTAEGDHRGPTLSLRGLDPGAYYLLTPDGGYLNLTATGNTVNANHPVTRRLVLDSLRHWAGEYRVDGFRFDMASILTRDGAGRPADDPPLLEAIARDPALAHCRLIAEATDATGLDQVGSFPHYGRWQEWNGRYRDGVRRFLAAKTASAGELATRLAGSADLYGGRGTSASVNYVTCHDGFTLADLVSYGRRHNEDNGQGGTDGIPDEDGFSCGAEGPSALPEVNRLRRRQTRNALLLPAVSHGIPFFLAGDEFGRTQRGNNNAYSQDNEISWVDWTLRDRNADLVEFLRRCLAFRRAHPVLRRPDHPDGRTPDGWAYPPVSWHGDLPDRPDWSARSRLVVGLFHQQPPAGPADTVLVAANSADRPRRVRVPAAPPGTRWHLFADTSATIGDPVGAYRPGAEPASVDDTAPLPLADHSVVVLVAHTEEPEELEERQR
ncbi:glycogen debranching protein [Streptomyces polygonati]|uniref:Glycogen debranching protein n=1 Tax=Streptomyces polygonati TaxID=1617087 RepID=A0ABV8HHX9_9ACTN